MTQTTFDLTPLNTQNLAGAYTGNYYTNIKNKIVAAVEQADYYDSEQPEQDYLNAVTEKDFIAAAYYATCTEQPELLLVDAINDYCIELVFALLALGVDVNYQHVEQDDIISYPITLALGWANKQLANLFLLHPDIDLYVLGESLCDEHEIRQALGFDSKDGSVSPLILLLSPEYKDFLPLLDLELNVEFENYQTLSELVLARANIQEVVSFVNHGGKLVDADNYPAIQSAYYSYISNPNKHTRANLLFFKPLIKTCLAYEEEHWLVDLLSNINDDVQQDVVHLLDIDEAIAQLDQDVTTQSAELSSPDIDSIVLPHYPEVKLDITLDIKTLNPWALPPFIHQLFIKQTQDGCLQFQVENSTGQNFIFDIPNLLKKGCATELMFNVFVHQNLAEISGEITKTIHNNHQELNSLAINYMPALFDLVMRSKVLVINDNDNTFTRLFARPFERDLSSLEEFSYLLSEQSAKQPKCVVEIFNDRVTLMYFNHQHDSYHTVMSYDFCNEEAQQQAYALTISQVWQLAGKN